MDRRPFKRILLRLTAEQRQRSQSSKRYQEMERERKRRQLKTASGSDKTSFFQVKKLQIKTF